MMCAGLFLSIVRDYARIIDLEDSCDNQHLGEAAPLSCGQQHATQPRVDRQPGQLTSNRGQLVLSINRIELAQKSVTSRNLPRFGGVNERETLDPAKLHRR